MEQMLLSRSIVTANTKCQRLLHSVDYIIMDAQIWADTEYVNMGRYRIRKYGQIQNT